jgi:hypothetical protein
MRVELTCKANYPYGHVDLHEQYMQGKVWRNYRIDKGEVILSEEGGHTLVWALLALGVVLAVAAKVLQLRRTQWR